MTIHNVATTMISDHHTTRLHIIKLIMYMHLEYGNANCDQNAESTNLNIIGPLRFY